MCVVLFCLYVEKTVSGSEERAVSRCWTVSWPAGHICPTYKESFQVHWNNSIPLSLHAATYLEVSLFRWTSQNAFSHETAMYKWYCVQCSYAEIDSPHKMLLVTEQCNKSYSVCSQCRLCLRYEFSEKFHQRETRYGQKVTLLHVECPQYVINHNAAYSIGFKHVVMSHMNFVEKPSNGSRVTGVNALLFV
jgi:hypothetical protein